MELPSLVLTLFFLLPIIVFGNLEGDILYTWKTKLTDPNNVLQSWNSTLANPCTWLHITCNSDNEVTRVDLGNSSLSGIIEPQLGLLTNLSYLELYDNKFNRSIPWELGHLSNLISLDLYNNQLSGVIPSTLGNLKSLAYLRIHGNNITGTLPVKVLQLVQWGNLQILNVSNNQLIGTKHEYNNGTGNATTRSTTIIQDARLY